MPITQPSDIRLNRQNDLEAIIGHPPGWSLRWGMTVLFGCMVLLIGISWFVSYPDIVEARAVLTTENPPIRLVAGASAKIVSLKKENGDRARRGELLGILENPAKTEDVFTLEKAVAGLAENDASTYLSTSLPDNLKLGSLQNEYARLVRNFEDLQYYLSQNANYLKINNLRTQISEILNMDRSLEKQVAIFENELALYQKNVQRDSILYSQNSLSELEYEQSQSSYLLMKRQLENLRSGSAKNRLDIQQLEAQIIDLQQLQSDTQNDRILAIRNDIHRLKGEIANWKQTWLLIAPISGEIALTHKWSEQQFVNAGEEIMTIVPRESAGAVIAKATLTGPNAGKVKEGMEAHLRLDGFPFQEFGLLNGTVGRIAPVPSQNGYEIEIKLPENLVTSYGKPVPFRQEMEGTARIVTEERSLLMRVMEKIRAAFDE